MTPIRVEGVSEITARAEHHTNVELIGP
jgi:hypothetical protein